MDDLVQDYCNSSALAMELLQSCKGPSTSCYNWLCQREVPLHWQFLVESQCRYNHIIKYGSIGEG